MEVIMKKILTTILAIIIVAANISFAACNNGKGVGSSNEAPPVDGTPAAGETQKPTDEDPYDKTAASEEESLNVDLDELDYGNKELTIYHSTLTVPEFDVDEKEAQAGTLSEAVYKRNMYTQKNLGIKLDYIEKNGNFGDKSPFMSDLRVTVENPESSVGIIAAQSQTAAYLHVTGLIKELIAYEDDLKLDRAWWPGNVREENDIKGRVYYITGDISPSLLKSMSAVFVNKKIANELGRNANNSLIELVKNGYWTIDEMIGMTNGVYRDLDDVYGKSNGDTYGAAFSAEDAANAFWTGMGYKYVDRSDAEDELYKLSEDFIAGEAFVTKMYGWWSTMDVFNENFGNPNETAVEAFSRSGAMLLCSQIGKVDPEACADDYTVLPAPKLDSSQENYHTAVGSKYVFYSICYTYDDTELAARTIQTMGFYGYHLTTPAVVEELFGTMSDIDADDEALFNIIRNSITLDSGRIIERHSGTFLVNKLANMATYNLWPSGMSIQNTIIHKNDIRKSGNAIIESVIRNAD